MNAQQAIIIAEAARWIGTPYHHSADVIHEGVDCAMLPVRVFCDLGIVPPFDPRPYPPDWHLHRSVERYLVWVEKFATRHDEPQPADLALFKVGRCLSHGGIVTSKTQMIHACIDAGRVVRADLSGWAHRCAGYWRIV